MFIFDAALQRSTVPHISECLAAHALGAFPDPVLPCARTHCINRLEARVGRTQDLHGIAHVGRPALGGRYSSARVNRLALGGRHGFGMGDGH